MAHPNRNHFKRGAPRRDPDARQRELMCDIGRRLWTRGLCAGNEGNLSCRLSGDRILCTPTQISKGQLWPDDLCIMDLNGKQISGRRKTTSEINMHLHIYRNRGDTGAVVHSHPPHATAFAIAGIELPPCIHPEAEVFLGPVKTAPYTTPGDHRLGESIAPFIADHNTVLLANHGVVCWSRDLEDAYYKLEIVDAYARMLILARQLGRIQTFTPAQMKDLLALKPRFGQTDPRIAPDGSIGELTCSSDFVELF